MSQEIIYTSSPQGLRPGSFGFCTVATTSGMATSLAEKLEALSGYRHVHPPGQPQAVNNPVVFSHLLLKVGGQRLHVLSRVADAGLDYSQRTNKLAHHVVFEPTELVPAGPAWVLSQPGFAETAWSGAPRIMPRGRIAPRGDIYRGVCQAWQAITGDAGWAGVLAQHALQANRPAHLVFPEGTNPLPLLVEAQSLLPAARRWEVSFSTYFTRLPPGVDCLWRCVLAGSAEAQAAAGLRGDLVIDLTRPLGAAPDGPLVNVARSGAFPAEPEAARPPALTVAQPPASAGTVAPPVRPARPMLVVDDDQLQLAPPPRDPPHRGGAVGPPTLASRSRSQPPALKSKRSYRNVWITVGGIAALVLAFVGGTLWNRPVQVVQAPQSNNDPAPIAQTPPETPKNDEGTPTPAITQQPRDQVDAPESKQPPLNHSDTPPSDDASQPADQPTSSTPIGSAAQSSSQPETIPRPFAFSRIPEVSVSLPRASLGDSTVATFLLTTFPAANVPQIDGIDVIGASVNGQQVECVQTMGRASWEIRIIQNPPADAPIVVAVISMTPKDDSQCLVFKWTEAMQQYRSACVLLPYSAIRIHQPNCSPAVMQLCRPVIDSRIKLNASLRFSQTLDEITASGVSLTEFMIDVIDMNHFPAQGKDSLWPPLVESARQNERQKDYRHPSQELYVLTVEAAAQSERFVLRGGLSWNGKQDIHEATEKHLETFSEIVDRKNKAIEDKQDGERKKRDAANDKKSQAAKEREADKKITDAVGRITKAEEDEKKPFPPIVKSELGRAIVRDFHTNKKKSIFPTLHVKVFRRIVGEDVDPILLIDFAISPKPEA